jgi:hypothetical protein
MVEGSPSLTPLVIERLDKSVHDRGGFDCGEPSLNDYLKFTARQHMDRGYAQVWVAVPEPGSPRIIGYYTLSTSALEPEEMPGKSPIRKIPVVLLDRLAVDKQIQGPTNRRATSLPRAEKRALALNKNRYTGARCGRS